MGFSAHCAVVEKEWPRQNTFGVLRNIFARDRVRVTPSRVTDSSLVLEQFMLSPSHALPALFKPRAVPTLDSPTQYQRVFAAESSKQQALQALAPNSDSGLDFEGDIVCLRVLGQCMLQVDTPQGLLHLTMAIASSTDDELSALGNFYLTFVRICPWHNIPFPYSHLH
jgi:hypothetical protein